MNARRDQTEQNPAVVVGGGVAGLTAATLLAQAGKRVHLYEKGRALGGRATTQEKEGFLFNQGPHALYAASAGVRVLQKLGVPFAGKMPKTGGLAYSNGELKQLIVSPGSLIHSPLLPWSGKLHFARFFMAISRTDPKALQSVTLREWVESITTRDDVQQLTYALTRVATYANAPEQLSAGATIEQI